MSEWTAHSEVQGEVSHDQQDPHPVSDTATWPQSRRTAEGRESNIKLNMVRVRTHSQFFTGHDMGISAKLVSTEFV